MERKTADCAQQFEQIIQKYGDMVYRLAYSQTGCQAGAEDVFQEVILRLLKKPRHFKSEEHRKAWLIRVTINCSKNFYRTLLPLTAIPLEEQPVQEEAPFQDLEEALNKLPLKYRQVIHLFYYEDLPVAKISLLLHRKESTVRTQLTRARAMLKEWLKGDYDEF